MSGLKPTWTKIEAVPRSSSTFFLVYIPSFCLLFPLFDTLPSSNLLFFPFVCRPAPHWYPISVTLFLKAPNLLFYFSFFHQNDSRISAFLLNKMQNINAFELCDVKVSIWLARSLALCQQCTKIRSGTSAPIVVRSHGGEISTLTGKITRRSAAVTWYAAVRECVLSSTFSQIHLGYFLFRDRMPCWTFSWLCSHKKRGKKL